MLLGVAAGYVYGAQSQPTYQASASILVLPTAAGLDTAVSESRQDTFVQIETEAQLVRSMSVAQAASDRIDGVVSAAALAQDSSVVIPSNSQVLVVGFKSSSSRAAQLGATALAEAYVQMRADEAVADLLSIIARLERERSQLAEQLAQYATQIAAVPTDERAKLALLESQRALVVEQVADVSSRLVALGIQADLTRGGRVISAAERPRDASSPGPLTTAAVGAALGGLAAAGLLLGWSRRRRSIPAGAGSAYSRGVPVLGTLELIPVAGQPVGSPADVVAANREALRRLCLKIEAHESGEWPVALVGTGDSQTRALVAKAFNQMWADQFGGSVLVLSSPQEQPATSDRPGLTDVLMGEAGAIETVTLPVGSFAGEVGPGSAVERGLTDRHRARLPEVWRQLEAEFGAVLVESGSPLDSSLAQAVAQTSARFVVLVEAGHAQRGDLGSTLEELEWLTLSDRVIGVVLVSRPDDRSATQAEPVAQPRSVGVLHGQR